MQRGDRAAKASRDHHHRGCLCRGLQLALLSWQVACKQQQGVCAAAQRARGRLERQLRTWIRPGRETTRFTAPCSETSVCLSWFFRSEHISGQLRCEPIPAVSGPCHTACLPEEGEPNPDMCCLPCLQEGAAGGCSGQVCIYLVCRCAFTWCAGQSPAAGTAQPHSSSGERGAGDGEGAAEEAGRALMAAHGEERLHMQLPPNRSSLCGVGQPKRESGKKKESAASVSYSGHLSYHSRKYTQQSSRAELTDVEDEGREV